jgi:acyl carrier protein phosphodiesterase
VNFLAHFWLTDKAQLPLAGALLGDVLRGALPAHMPPALAASVTLHRRVDATTDRHPRVVAARSGFEPGARRYAGIVLDLLFDHVLARDWPAYSAQPLPAFADRAAQAVHEAGAWFEHAGERTPEAAPFSALLQSYASPGGIERAIERTARRLRVPGGMLDAAAGWPGRLPGLTQDLPVLLADLAGLQPAIDQSLMGVTRGRPAQ